MPRDIHGILLLDKPLSLVPRVRLRASNACSRPQGGTHRFARPLGLRALADLFWRSHQFGAQMLDADKAYRVTLRLGERTPSADRETEVIERRALPQYSFEDIEQALAGFPRNYQQTPPMHSALKQDGKPLYEYARAGVTRERAARTVDHPWHAGARMAAAGPDLRCALHERRLHSRSG